MDSDMPALSRISWPKVFLSLENSSLDNGAEPETNSLMELVSYFSSPSTSSSLKYIVGTPMNKVAFLLAIVSSTSSATNFFFRIVKLPTYKEPHKATPMPWIWYKGSVRRKISSSAHFHACASAFTFEVTLVWVKAAPFGFPVVPEV